MNEKRFQVVVRFQSDSPSVHPSPGFEDARPLVYEHGTPAAAARRLASLIAGRAAWVPRSVRCGKIFQILDRTQPGRAFALTEFRSLHDV